MDSKALYSLSYGVYVLGVRSPFGFGGCIVDALAQVSSGNVPAIVLASMKNNYSNELIKTYGEFTLSVLPKTVDPRVIAAFGYQSARGGIDKWVLVPHTMRDGMPYADGAIAYMRFHVTKAVETETHTVFFADMTDAQLGDNSTPLLYAEYRGELKQSVSAAYNSIKEGKAHEAKRVCKICGYTYEGETPFEELPADWTCPLCGAGKEEFDLV